MQGSNWRVVVAAAACALICFSANGVRAEVEPAGGSAASGERLRLAVMDFAEGNVDAAFRGSIGATVANAVSAELSKDNRFDLFERGRLQTIVKEQAFQNQGLVDEATATRIGKLAGVSYLAYGEVELAQAKVERTTPDKKGNVYYNTEVQVAVTYKATNVSDGLIWKQKRIELKESLVYQADPPSDATKTQMALKCILRGSGDFVRMLVPQVQGIVALVDPATGTFVITLGSANGIGKGLDFRVFRKGQEIKNPVTGEVIASSTQEVCRAKATEVMEKAARLEPGEYGKSVWTGVKWKSRAKDQLKLIQVGDLVEPIEGQRPGGGLFGN